MFELDVTREFSAAHSLRGYNGQCSALHGHNWTVQVFVRSSVLDEIGMSVDFRILKKELDQILEELDHHFLNELSAFKDINPTSENLAMYFYKRLAKAVNTDTVRIYKVRISESANSGATYREPETDRD